MRNANKPPGFDGDYYRGVILYESILSDPLELLKQ